MKAYLIPLLLTLTILGAHVAESQVASDPAATNAPASSAPKTLSAAELEKLVLPIALHPDPLIAIILPASVYPLEIVQAARFVKDTNNIPKVDEQPWDDNVKELAKFPDMIAKMDADLPWTMQLGDAFLNQGKELMDTIQSLRAKAQKAGTLQTSPQQIVTVTNIIVYETNVTHEVNTVTKEIVQVQPANPQVVYVPSYPPTVYYPPPAYVYNPIAPLVTFGVGMAWGAVLANNCNWGGGDVDVDVNRNVNRNTNRSTDRNTDRSAQRSGTQQRSGGSQKWQPDKSRMSKSGSQTVQNRDARGWGGNSAGGAGAANRSSQMASTRGAGAGQGQRPSAGTQPSRSAGAGQGAGNRASPSASSRSGGSSAFSGVNSGSSARSASNRGASSRGGGGGGGRGGGGGGGGRR
jgi:hypothetical protein